MYGVVWGRGGVGRGGVCVFSTFYTFVHVLFICTKPDP